MSSQHGESFIFALREISNLNYLSHYYVDYPEDRPYYVLGLILPDLVRKIEPRKIRFSAEALMLESPPSEIADHLNQGIMRHLEVDILFHNSPYFHKGCQVIKDWLSRFTYKSIPNRIHIFAHVLLEIMIDRVLIKKDPEIMDRFYNNLDQVEKQPLLDFFAHNGIIHSAETVYERVRYFCEDRFLCRYPDNDMMLYALNVLNQKMGNSVIEAEDEDKLLDTIALTEKWLLAEQLSIFGELRNHA